MLNKEFQQKDVQRLRNLVKGKYGEKTTVGVGYTKKYEFHNEGDVWEEENRTWTIKNGIKQNITKLDKAKQIGVLPLLCPNCNKLMRTHIDKPFYNIHNKCMNCVVEFETKLRIEGKWEEYQKRVHNEEIDRLINNFKDWSEDELKATDTFVTEVGDVETWVGGNNTKIIEQNIKESIKFLENLKKQ